MQRSQLGSRLDSERQRTGRKTVTVRTAEREGSGQVGMFQIMLVLLRIQINSANNDNRTERHTLIFSECFVCTVEKKLGLGCIHLKMGK